MKTIILLLALGVVLLAYEAYGLKKDEVDDAKFSPKGELDEPESSEEVSDYSKTRCYRCRFVKKCKKVLRCRKYGLRFFYSEKRLCLPYVYRSLFNCISSARVLFRKKSKKCKKGNKKCLGVLALKFRKAIQKCRRVFTPKRKTYYKGFLKRKGLCLKKCKARKPKRKQSACKRKCLKIFRRQLSKRYCIRKRFKRYFYRTYKCGVLCVPRRVCSKIACPNKG